MSAKQQMISEAIRDAKQVVGELIDGQRVDKERLNLLELRLARALDLSDEVYHHDGVPSQ